MSYYRSFANLVGFLGLITLGLILVVVIFASRIGSPVAELAEEPVPEFNPPWATPETPAADHLDREALARLRESVPVAPARVSGNDWLIDEESVAGAESDLAMISDVERGTDSPGSVQDPLQVAKGRPRYPDVAIEHEIYSGRVLVEFAVNASGGVQDVKIVDSTNPVFDEAAIDAASKFRYRPKLVDGMPIDVSGIQHEFKFEFTDGSDRNPGQNKGAPGRP